MGFSSGQWGVEQQHNRLKAGFRLQYKGSDRSEIKIALQFWRAAEQRTVKRYL